MTTCMKCGGDHSTIGCKTTDDVIKALTNSRVPEVIYWQQRAIAAEQVAKATVEAYENLSKECLELGAESEQLRAKLSEANETVKILIGNEEGFEQRIAELVIERNRAEQRVRELEAAITRIANDWHDETQTAGFSLEPPHVKEKLRSRINQLRDALKSKVQADEGTKG